MNFWLIIIIWLGISVIFALGWVCRVIVEKSNRFDALNKLEDQDWCTEAGAVRLAYEQGFADGFKREK